MHEYTAQHISAATRSDHHSQSIPEVEGSPPTVSRSTGLRAQLGYADRGKSTFPAEPGGKKPLIKDWPNRASTDPRMIHMWGARFPQANIGMPTGEHNRVWVLDIDRPEALAELEAKIGKLPATLTARTPRGGWHLYFRHVEGITNSPGGLPNGIDVRGEGGYVLVPPSAGYSWEDRSPAVEAPPELVELVREKGSKAGAKPPPTTHTPTGEVISEGRRNSTLTSICGGLHDGTRTEGELAAELLAVKDTRCENPETFTDAEVRAIARWTHSKAPCRVGRPPEVEERVRELEAAFWEMWGEDFRGLGGQSDRDLLRVILESAARWGRVNDQGEVEFDRSTQDMALEAGVSRPTVHAAAKRLGEKIGLRRDTRDRKASHAGKWILPPAAQVFTTRINASQHPVESNVGAVVKTCAPRVVGLSTPTFRHFGTVGKGRGGVLLALEAFGSISADRLADELGVARPRDLRRRYLDWLVEEGRVELRGGLYALPGDHSERCEEAKSRRYSSVRRRRVRSYSPDEGRRVTTVVEVGSESSERQREAASRRAYADQRELFLRRVALRSPEADEACRELLNRMDDEREAACEVREITHLRDVTPESGPKEAGSASRPSGDRIGSISEVFDMARRISGREEIA